MLGAVFYPPGDADVLLLKKICGIKSFAKKGLSQVSAVK